MELTSLIRAAKGSREQQVNLGTGDTAAMGTCPFCLHPPASRDEPRKGEAVPRERPEGTGAPAAFNAARTTRQGWRPQVPSHPSLTASRDFS